MKINTITVDRNSPIGLFDSGIGGWGLPKKFTLFCLMKIWSIWLILITVLTEQKLLQK